MNYSYLTNTEYWEYQDTTRIITGKHRNKPFTISIDCLEHIIKADAHIQYQEEQRLGIHLGTMQQMYQWATTIELINNRGKK